MVSTLRAGFSFLFDRGVQVAKEVVPTVITTTLFLFYRLVYITAPWAKLLAALHLFLEAAISS